MGFSCNLSFCLQIQTSFLKKIEHRNSPDNFETEQKMPRNQATNRAEECDRKKTAFLTYMPDHIQRNSDSLIFQVNDILYFSNIESKRSQISEESFSLNVILTGITSYWHRQRSNKNIEFKLYLSGINLHPIHTDSYRIKQILSNNNTFKITGKECFQFTGEINPKNFVCAMNNTGIGIHNKYEKVIFEHFVKFENVNKQKNT